MNCPRCDAELEHQEYDPSVGVLSGGWYCEACDLFVDDSEIDHSDELYNV